MKKFLFKVSTFLIGLAMVSYSVCFFVNYGMDAERSDFMAAIIDKHARIESIKTPKMVFAGGSNLAFGLNSELLEKEFSIPVVNLGLHGGLGLTFILEELKDAICEGDIVFISPEYFLDSEGVYKLKRHVSSYYAGANKYYERNLSWELNASLEEIDLYVEKTRKNMNAFLYSRNSRKKLSESFKIYSREAFNKHGDIIVHTSKYTLEELRDSNIMQYKFWDEIHELNTFFEYAKQRNIEVFYVFPPYALSAYKKNRDVIENLRQEIVNNIKAEVVGAPMDFVYDDIFFYDTVYHLNEEGRTMRTKKLIELLQENVRIHLYAGRVMENAE